MRTLLALALVGCASAPDTGSLMCSKGQYAAYERAGMDWTSCDSDKRLFVYYVATGRNWKQINAQFDAFIAPRLKKIRKQQEARK